MLMYSNDFIGVPRKKFLTSKHMYLAPSVDMVLFQRHLEVVMSAERVKHPLDIG
jgi:hypothetical protein